MRPAVALFVHLLIATNASASDFDSDSRAIIRVAIQTAVEGAVNNWEISDPLACFVVADRTTTWRLPPSEAETKRVAKAYERLAAGESVPKTQLETRDLIPKKISFSPKIMSFHESW